MYSLNQFGTSCLILSNQKVMESRIAHLGHQFGILCLIWQSYLEIKWEYKRWDCAFGSLTQQSKGLWKAGLCIWITNSALRASTRQSNGNIKWDCKQIQH